MDQKDAELLLKISHADSLQELVDLGFQLLGNPIFIDDMYRNVLAYSQDVTIDDPLWQENIVENIHDESTGSQMASKQMYKKSLETQRPVLLTDLPTVQRYAMTLTNYGVPIGNVTIAAHIHHFVPGDELLFELFCNYAAELLGNSHFSFRRSQPIVVNTLIRLLDGDHLTRIAVESKLNFYKKNTLSKNFLLLISDKTGDALSCPRQPVIETLSMIPGTIAFTYQSYIVCIYSGNGIQRQNAQTQLLDILNRYDLFAGISNHFRDIMQLPHYYTQAQSALKLSKLNENCRTYPYNDIAIFDLFDTLASQTNLLKFCEEKLMDLLAYDKAHGDNLLKTLQVYLETCLHYEETARQLFVHKNTVRYRIAKCQKFLNTDFTDGKKIFQYTLSLKILEYYHYIE